MPPAGLWSPVVAHQGGWDEVLYVALPIAVFAVLLWLANRRAKAHLGAGGDDGNGRTGRDER